MRLVSKTGLDYVETVTELLRRIHVSHPTGGLYQAAELQFWWMRKRRTDDLAQLFWLDDQDRPIAGAVLVDFGDQSSILYDEVTFCPLVVAATDREALAEVLDAGLAHAASAGFAAVEVEVAHDDDVMRSELASRGFELRVPEMLVECWMPATDRAAVSPLADGYRLMTRAELADRPHHMNRPDDDVTTRLTQLPLYEPAHDLVVFADDDTPAGWCIVWFDPATRTGVVEPVRTDDDHQRRGVARHLLTTGLELLARAGAERISIGYEPDNPASGHLYRDVGFEPVGGSDLWSGPTG